MRFKFIRAIAEFFQILVVGIAIPKERMHQSAGQCTIGARPYTKKKISLFRGGVAIRVDDDNFCAPLPPCPERMGYYVDLGAGRVGTPDDDKIRLRHFSWVDSGQASGAGNKAIPRRGNANGRVRSRITLHVT